MILDCNNHKIHFVLNEYLEKLWFVIYLLHSLSVYTNCETKDELLTSFFYRDANIPLNIYFNLREIYVRSIEYIANMTQMLF